MAEDSFQAIIAAYRKRFGPGHLGWCNTFALSEREVMDVLKRALERGTLATDEEIRWLTRDVRDDVIY